MGLRLSAGIDAAALQRRFGIAVVDWPRVNRLVESGHVARSDTRIAVTPEGRLVLDRVLAEVAA
jgi:oxygen-independent coproporphyrinogen-3 oxidase